MFLFGATCLSVDHYFSELALQKPTKRVGLVERGYHINIKPVVAMI